MNADILPLGHGLYFEELPLAIPFAASAAPLAKQT